MQLHIIHQRPSIMIVYNMISNKMQNNIVSIGRFHGIDILTLFQWGVNKMKTVDQFELYDDFLLYLLLLLWNIIDGSNINNNTI